MDNNTVIKNLISALEDVMLRCHHCDNVATWFCQDEDGTGYVCDKHKDNCFYAYGPEELYGYKNALKVIEGAKEYINAK